jgi:hypothetical protein
VKITASGSRLSADLALRDGPEYSDVPPRTRERFRFLAENGADIIAASIPTSAGIDAERRGSDCLQLG